MKRSGMMLSAALVMIVIAGAAFVGVELVETLRWGVWTAVLQWGLAIGGILFTIGFGIGLASAIAMIRRGK